MVFNETIEFYKATMSKIPPKMENKINVTAEISKTALPEKNTDQNLKHIKLLPRHKKGGGGRIIH